MSDDNPVDKTNADGTSVRAHRLLEIAGDLVLATEVLPGPVWIPDLDALRKRDRIRKARRRATWAMGSLAATAAVGILVATAISGRRDTAILSYVVEGTSTVQGNAIEAPLSDAGAGPRGDTRIRFAEGTAIALSPGTRLRIPSRTAVGADLILDRGRASLAVVHRPGATWRVTAGPFVVDVTGTRFSLEWASAPGRLTLDLEAGQVVVRGDVAGPGIVVRPGERLVASILDKRVTVQPAVHRQRVTADPIPGAGVEENTNGGDPTTSAGASPSPSAAANADPNALPAPVPAPVSVYPNRRIAGFRDLAIASPTRTRPDIPWATPARPGGNHAVDSQSEVQPPPILAPSAPSLVMGGGGAFCTGDHATLGFEGSEIGASVPPYYHLAFSGPRKDSTHSWCGIGSVRLDVNFDEIGRRNFMGRLPHQSGQVVIRLPQMTDFTDKTVSLHVFIDGPSDTRVAAQIFVIHHGKWVNGPIVDHLVPKRWWTISHAFRAENPLTVGPPYPPGGTSLVTDCDRIALIIYSTGGPRTWSGKIYVDDVGWN